MRMKLTLLTALLGVMVAAAAPAAVAAPPSAGISAPVTGTCSFFDEATDQTVTGTIDEGLFTVTGFSAPGGVLSVTGTLTGICEAENSLGDPVTEEINRTITLPLTGVQGNCKILHLEVGPVDLNLLGLMVHLDKIVLDITAQSGPGNLLGNLLCGIANALNGGAPANVLANLLNQILAILG